MLPPHPDGRDWDGSLLVFEGRERSLGEIFARSVVTHGGAQGFARSIAGFAPNTGEIVIHVDHAEARSQRVEKRPRSGHVRAGASTSAESAGRESRSDCARPCQGIDSVSIHSRVNWPAPP